MKIKPLNGYVVLREVAQTDNKIMSGILVGNNDSIKAKVCEIAPDCLDLDFKVDDVVFFNNDGCDAYKDDEGEYYLVKADAVMGLWE